MFVNFSEYDFIMLIGLPGSGKSTLIGKEFSGDGYKVISTDEIRKELSGDVSDQGLNIKVWELALQRSQNLLDLGYVVVLDACNVHTLYRRNFMRDIFSRDDIVSCGILFDMVDIGVLYSRIRGDLDRGIDRSDVPYDVLERMRSDYEDTLNVIGDEDWDYLYRYSNGRLLNQ